MALRKRGTWWHADGADDLGEYLLKHVLGRHKKSLAHHVTHARCACGGTVFDLFTDATDRIMRTCASCKADHPICDLDRTFDPDSAGEIVCSCMYSRCEVAVGFGFSVPKTAKTKTKVNAAAQSEPEMKYLYVAGRCVECGLCGVYTEWSAPKSFPASAWFESV
jgi:hypothetical protein